MPVRGYHGNHRIEWRALQDSYQEIINRQNNIIKFLFSFGEPMNRFSGFSGKNNRLSDAYTLSGNSNREKIVKMLQKDPENFVFAAYAGMAEC